MTIVACAMIESKLLRKYKNAAYSYRYMACRSAVYYLYKNSAAVCAYGSSSSGLLRISVIGAVFDGTHHSPVTDWRGSAATTLGWTE